MERLVPLKDLKRALAMGLRPHELAELFGVTQAFLEKCLRYYHEAKGEI